MRIPREGIRGKRRRQICGCADVADVNGAGVNGAFAHEHGAPHATVPTSAARSPLPPALRAEVVELLARLVVADLRKSPNVSQSRAVGDVTGVARRGPEAQ